MRSGEYPKHVINQASSNAKANSVDDYHQADEEYNAHITERFKSLRMGKQDTANQPRFGTRGYRLELNRNIATYIREQEAISSKAQASDWLAIPEIPTASELLVNERDAVALPANRIDKPWNRPQKYLRAHYKLLREDAISALRGALVKFRRDPQRMDDKDIRVYEQVHIVGFTFSHKGIAARIRFSTVRAGRQIQWAASKRLTSGTMVALSPIKDSFASICIIAIVAARPIQNLDVNPPEIDIFFRSSEDIEVDTQQSFVMVEATQGYFEAYRHTLTALQKQAHEQFPLSEYICQLTNNIAAPQYLQQQPHKNLSSAAPAISRDKMSHVDIMNHWPEASDSILDRFQWDAMNQFLTKSLAVIQGPPGTGKTYVSKVALEILIQNRLPDDPPIIVACQTNHALDQLLLKVGDFDQTYIRLGGRSGNAEVKERALFKVRNSNVIGNVPGSNFRSAKRDLSSSISKLKSKLTMLIENANDTPFLAKDLEAIGVISQGQRESLEKGASEWVTSDGSGEDALQMWLGRTLSPFRVVYPDDEPGFLDMEEDLEFEQLQELEAEHGVADEEDLEALKGDFVSLANGCTIPRFSQMALDEASKMLQTQEDLWLVPEHLRGVMYMIMQAKVKQVIKQQFQEEARNYAKIAKQLQIAKWEKDAVYLQKASIIGLTTTAISKYRALVSSLKPKILLVEEASEVLEGSVVTGCFDSLEHLILVGDHMQLQASCSETSLIGPPYYLNISMFERLMRGNVPHKTLLRQRRMNPTFRHLISEIYPGLEDHKSVIDRPIVCWGLGEVRSYYFNHEFDEAQDESMSVYNEWEARMVAKFYRHLIRNNVPAEAITVLTFYNGQRKKILQELKKDEETANDYSKVKTVDSYQGEENYIVILSLVRYNPFGKIGFLDVNNRIVVACSRAKYGFYLFGNGSFLSEKNELWGSIERKMRATGRFGTRLPLTCAKHGNQTFVEYPEDFDKNAGGCNRPCTELLRCGHKCWLTCHPFEHDRIICQQICGEVLSCGHVCEKECGVPCACDCGLSQPESAVQHCVLAHRFVDPDFDPDEA